MNLINIYEYINVIGICSVKHNVLFLYTLFFQFAKNKVKNELKLIWLFYLKNI